MKALLQMESFGLKQQKTCFQVAGIIGSFIIVLRERLEVVDVSSGVTGVSEGPVGGPRGLGGSTVDAGPAKKKNSWSLVNITPPPS